MKKKQRKIFLEFEGNNWYNRNKSILLKFDPNYDFPIKLIELYQIKPNNVLEIGCCFGYRLNYINKIFRAKCFGIEPSLKAVEEGEKRYPNIKIIQGTFSEIPLDEKFDLIITNFVFHWIDRGLLAKCVNEIERLLLPGGYLIIGDFFPKYPKKNKYHHLPKEDIWTFKQNYSKLFLSLENYILIALFTTSHDSKNFVIETIDDKRIAYSLLMKIE